MRCVRIRSDKKSHTNIRKDDVENMAATVNEKVNKKNDSSPQSREQPVSSTPLRKMPSANAEDSPDLDCYSSPIFPCTQEGGNEVAWDWQSSLNKTPEGRSKKQKAPVETPKGTKLLQRKRNSNSPLLYKPLKRKTMFKMEHMENIGQFTAELQALNEKVRFIKQTDKNSDVLSEEKPPIVASTDSKEEVTTVQGKEQDCIGEPDSRDNAGKNNAGKNNASGYEDLFDDSIDDCMARCTQEIEEKFNLITDKGAAPHSETSAEKEEPPSNKPSPVQSTSNEREPSVGNFLRKSISDNNTLKTYSKLSLRRDASSSIHVLPIRNEKELQKWHLNNNSMIRPHLEKSSDHTRVPKSKIELFDFPDDSFDDCLASCVEDEKLLSASTGSDNLSSQRNDATKYEASCKNLIQAPLKSEAKSSSSIKTAGRDEASSCAFKNKKFFKTKSLSDQYNIGHDTLARSTSNASSSSSFIMRSKSSSNSTKSTTAAHTGATRGSVSSNPIATNHRKVETSAISLTRDGTGRTHGSDVNRCAVREGGDRFGRYHSTGNMRNNTTETRSGSLPAQCTAEEIEQKRLQAKMRLEARRKLNYLRISNNIKR